MNLSGLLPLLEDTPAYRQLVEAMAQAGQPLPAEPAPPGVNLRGGLGVIAPARPYVVAALYRQLGRPVILLTARAERVGQWIDQLCVWTGCEGVLPFPEPDALPYERVPWSRETISDRLSALAALVRWSVPVGAGLPSTGAGLPTEPPSPPGAPISAWGLQPPAPPDRRFGPFADAQDPACARVQARAARIPPGATSRSAAHPGPLGGQRLPARQRGRGSGHLQPARRTARRLSAQPAPAGAHRAVWRRDRELARLRSDYAALSAHDRALCPGAGQ